MKTQALDFNASSSLCGAEVGAYDRAVIIGRFQPFHAGHYAMLQAALQLAPKVTVVLGSADRAPSHKNPFTLHERIALIEAALRDKQEALERLHFQPIPDRFNIDAWTLDVRAAVQRAQESEDKCYKPNAESAQKVVLVGHFKDSSSYYLSHFPGWDLHTVDNVGGWNATKIRQELFQSILQAPSLPFSYPALSPSQNKWLAQWALGEAAKRLAQEWAFIQADNARWAPSPYPPIWVTVDALVCWRDQVLLIQRKSHPGAGLWALPGGYVEQSESLFSAALRELAEETGLVLEGQRARACLQAVQVFDHPERSIKGRIISHAHHFVLDDAWPSEAPLLQASDDAQALRWVPRSELPSYVNKLHDDHGHIIHTMLNLEHLGSSVAKQ